MEISENTIANPDPKEDMTLVRYDLGLAPYLKAWEYQKALHNQVVNFDIDHAFISLEHPKVITLGKNATPNNVTVEEKLLTQFGVELIRSDRGGDVTMHMPGQLVCYPILHLSRLNLSVKSYVNALETSVIKVLAGYGIIAHQDPIYPGIWVGTNKICAIGVRVKSHVTMHGIALNVTNQLSLFDLIVPCGIRDRGVTSLAKIMNPLNQLVPSTQTLAEQVYLTLANHLRIKCTTSIHKADLLN